MHSDMGLRKALRRIWRLFHPQWTAMTPKQIREVDRAVSESMATGSFHTVRPSPAPQTGDQLWNMDTVPPMNNDRLWSMNSAGRMSTATSSSRPVSSRRPYPPQSVYYSEDPYHHQYQQQQQGWYRQSQLGRHEEEEWEEYSLPYSGYDEYPPHTPYERPRSQPYYRQSSAQPYYQHPQYYQPAYSDSGRY